jgi:hypothetical protein
MESACRSIKWRVNFTRLASLVGRGLPDEQIARQFGVSAKRVSGLRAYYGITDAQTPGLEVAAAQP